MDKFGKLIIEEIVEYINAGNEPNKIMEEIEKSIMKNTDYALWGDGRHRLDYVCSICGSPYMGVCGHKNDSKRKKILSKDYK